jgi:hypothetical protein
MESKLLSSKSDIARKNVTTSRNTIDRIQYTSEGSPEDFWIREAELDAVGGQIASTFNISVSDIPYMDYNVYSSWRRIWRKLYLNGT